MDEIHETRDIADFYVGMQFSDDYKMRGMFWEVLEITFLEHSQKYMLKLAINGRRENTLTWHPTRTTGFYFKGVRIDPVSRLKNNVNRKIRYLEGKNKYAATI